MWVKMRLPGRDLEAPEVEVLEVSLGKLMMTQNLFSKLWKKFPFRDQVGVLQVTVCIGVAGRVGGSVWEMP